MTLSSLFGYFSGLFNERDPVWVSVETKTDEYADWDDCWVRVSMSHYDRFGSSTKKWEEFKQCRTSGRKADLDGTVVQEVEYDGKVAWIDTKEIRVPT